jgi:hypothetical protein
MLGSATMKGSKRGRPTVPKRGHRSRRVVLYVEPDLFRAMETEAAREGYTLSTWLYHLVRFRLGR